MSNQFSIRTYKYLFDIIQSTTSLIRILRPPCEETHPAIRLVCEYMPHSYAHTHHHGCHELCAYFLPNFVTICAFFPSTQQKSRREHRSESERSDCSLGFMGPPRFARCRGETFSYYYDDKRRSAALIPRPARLIA